MSLPIHTTAGNHSGPKSQRGLEQYPTPPCATEAVLRVESLPRVIWEPCAGDGDIVRVLEAHGHHVVAHDIADDGIDFRDRREAPLGIDAIVTNPPFSLAADFVKHGLTLVPRVLILERIQWLEAETRADLFAAGKLIRIHVFQDRVPRMHRVGWNGKRSEPAMMLAWFVFDRDHDGSAPTLGWIRCREAVGNYRREGNDA